VRGLVSVVALAVFFLLGCKEGSAGPAGLQEVVTTPYQLPNSVSVLPVFFVAQGEVPPSPEQADRLMQHLYWTQRSNTGWLDGTTFRIASEQPEVFEAPHPL